MEAGRGDQRKVHWATRGTDRIRLFVYHSPEMVGKIQGGKSYLLPGRWLVLGVASGTTTHTFEAAFEGASDRAPITIMGVTVGLLGDPKK